jgi:UDP-N-acetylmuramoyl-tripeptide--D-alanyl-D-alanine ligase
MSVLTFEDIRIVMDAGWVIEPKPEAFDFVGVAIDTRAIEPGHLFFAFVGEQADGHDFLAHAAKAGAGMGIVIDASKVPNDLEMPVLVVADALEAITKLASAWRQRLKAKVIAITGSNGKTTTCRLVHSVCAQSGSSVVSQKSFNNALGVPITILNTPEDADYLIAELGTSSPGEIAARSMLIEPDIAVITSIGSAHLEELGDRDGVACEKAQIIKALSDGAHAIIVGGITELESALASESDRVQITRIGTEVPIEIVEATDRHTSFTLTGEGFTVPMLGRHNASNASLAIAVGRVLGIDDEMIRAGLMRAKLPAMRFDRIEIPTKTNPIVLYNDAYNANLDSMRASLQTFDALELVHPKIAILGDMLELGDHSAEQHRALVNELVNFPSIDRFILVGPSFADAASPSDRVMIYPEPDAQAMTQIARSVLPGSSLLLKGSRGIALERLVYILISSSAARPPSTKAHPPA